MPEQERDYSTAEVAARAGVHRDTLLRWLRQHRIAEPGRDRHGWRCFSDSEAKQIEEFARSGTLVEEPAPDYGTATPDNIRRLEALDWDFSDAKTDYLTHGLHPYPAKFIPQIPNALIQELSSVGETVADIFCGSGTTLVEALMLKRHAVGTDANPLACLITEAKTTFFKNGDIEYLSALVGRAETLAQMIYGEDQDLLFPTGVFSSQAPRPVSDAILFWFEPFVIEELAEILQSCREIPSKSARTIALTAFSSIVVAVSRQDSDTRYVRRQKQIKRGDTARRFSRALADAIHAVSEFTELVEPRFTCKVHNSNILDLPDIGKVQLVVCSPPYPNAYSYHLYHMTRMLWLGMNQAQFKREEIGSHRKYGRKSASIQMFKDEMLTILQWLTSHLEKGRYACFVVGGSADAQDITSVNLLSHAASLNGFCERGRISRLRSHSALDDAVPERQTILILQR